MSPGAPTIPNLLSHTPTRAPGAKERSAASSSVLATSPRQVEFSTFSPYEHIAMAANQFAGTPSARAFPPQQSVPLAPVTRADQIQGISHAPVLPSRGPRQIPNHSFHDPLSPYSAALSQPLVQYAQGSTWNAQPRSHLPSASNRIVDDWKSHPNVVQPQLMDMNAPSDLNIPMTRNVSLYPQLAAEPPHGTMIQASRRARSLPAMRKEYHPNPHSGGSEWVMWVGNVSRNVSRDELTAFFNNMFNIPHFSDHTASSRRAVSSVFMMPQSHCAFVNYHTEIDLARAVAHYHGRVIRPGGMKLVCRVRNREDEMHSGVGVQRGRGVHRKWVQKHFEKELAVEPDTYIYDHAIIDGPWQPEHERSRSRESTADDSDSMSSGSTTSSLLACHFPKRYFVIKSLSVVSFDVPPGLEAREC